MKKLNNFKPIPRKNRYWERYTLKRLLTLIVISLAINVSTLAAAQKNIRIEKQNWNVESLFKEVKDQTGLTVIYNNNKLNKNNIIHLKQGDMELGELMQLILKDEALDYELKDDYIVIKPQIIASPINGQQATQRVTGKITDKNGDPLPGVAIMVKGTQIGTATNAEGTFSIQIPEGSSVLVATFVGMIPKEVNIEGKSEITIVLEDDLTNLEEVVVTGMVTTDKRLFTGASQRIKAEDAKLAGIADVSRGLEGRAAGVSVQNVSGTFGTAPKIRVRGATSIYGNSKPLWV
ncbi:carboxypeptidase-like regulatory domain-containing protein [Saccharicrinis fermentans]|uniref:Outer membrane cobalamin receptor protein n=3 Tax=Saccharicrinis fermentans TaxID=982 RepID=W7YMT3_9BACT|nr:carboxypeptidase-like regulatory domain-containing protein [Saccharicrinis fermentans]GAF03709.1 outer membrane cobalamin receptor protein [Saccharicrinis fermentans DSM 9555 = JCM 21142]